jgi:YggT family protein
MFVFANFLSAVAAVLNMLLSFYWWILLARVIISWVNPDPYNQIVRFLSAATDPVLHRIRRAFPMIYTSGIDLSPLVVIAAIYFLQIFLVGNLNDMAFRLR